MQPVHDQFSKGIVNKNIMDQIRIKGLLNSEWFFGVFKSSKKWTFLGQIYSLASKMGQIKNNAP